MVVFKRKAERRLVTQAATSRVLRIHPKLTFCFDSLLPVLIQLRLSYRATGEKVGVHLPLEAPSHPVPQLVSLFVFSGSFHLTH